MTHICHFVKETLPMFHFSNIPLILGLSGRAKFQPGRSIRYNGFKLFGFGNE